MSTQALIDAPTNQLLSIMIKPIIRFYSGEPVDDNDAQAFYKHLLYTVNQGFIPSTTITTFTVNKQFGDGVWKQYYLVSGKSQEIYKIYQAWKEGRGNRVFSLPGKGGKGVPRRMDTHNYIQDEKGDVRVMKICRDFFGADVATCSRFYQALYIYSGRGDLPFISRKNGPGKRGYYICSPEGVPILTDMMKAYVGRIAGQPRGTWIEPFLPTKTQEHKKKTKKSGPPVGMKVMNKKRFEEELARENVVKEKKQERTSMLLVGFLGGCLTTIMVIELLSRFW